MVSPSMRRAWLAPIESNLYSPVGSPLLSSTGSACMHRSATVIRREITHSRSRPVFRIALCVAMLESWLMRSVIFVPCTPLGDSQALTVRMVTLRPAAVTASLRDMPMALARQ